MQLDDIEILMVISETKSLSQAAERLYMSRPGLSQKIANIEARYGTKLYNRTSTGVVPTAAGQIVTKFAPEDHHAGKRAGRRAGGGGPSTSTAPSRWA